MKSLKLGGADNSIYREGEKEQIIKKIIKDLTASLAKRDALELKKSKEVWNRELIKIADSYCEANEQIVVNIENFDNLDEIIVTYTGSKNAIMRMQGAIPQVNKTQSDVVWEFDEIKINPEWMDTIEKGLRIGKPRQ